MKWPKAQSVQEWRMLHKMFLQMEKYFFLFFNWNAYTTTQTCILLFRKDKLNWSKVTQKTCNFTIYVFIFQINYVLLNFLFIQKN